jgi:hypothetical protein
MKNKLYILGLILCAFTSNKLLAQSRYFIQFGDKANTSFSLQKPQEFLSERAIDRRKKFQINIDSADLPVDTHYIQTLQRKGYDILNISRWMNGVIVKADDKAIKKCIDFPFVKGYRYAAPAQIPDDTNHIDFKGFMSEVYVPKEAKGNYGQAYIPISQINGDKLHNRGLTGKGMLIAVLDAGFENAGTLPCFKNAIDEHRIVDTRDLVDRNKNVYNDNEHGTEVLSCMAALDSGKMIGTAPKASYILIRTEDYRSEFPVEEYLWVIGAELADSSGADIINTSLGYTNFDADSLSHTYNELDGNHTIAALGVKIAAAKGIFVCASMGNDGDKLWQYLGTPADAPDALSMGAVNSDGNIAKFSSIGPASDGHIKPDVVAFGEYISVASSTGGYFINNGTSFSTPVVCGMVACLMQAHPLKTSKEVMQAIRMSSNHFLQPDGKYGYGIPNFERASNILTYGKDSLLSSDTLMAAYWDKQTQQLVWNFYSQQTQSAKIKLLNPEGKTVFKDKVLFNQGFQQLYISKKRKMKTNGKYTLIITTSKAIYQKHIDLLLGN